MIKVGRYGALSIGGADAERVGPITVYVLRLAVGDTGSPLHPPLMAGRSWRNDHHGFFRARGNRPTSFAAVVLGRTIMRTLIRLDLDISESNVLLPATGTVG